MGLPRVHDRAILDALESAETIAVSVDVWRITRAGRDPLRGSEAPGRWSPGGIVEVLYTSLERDGALAEIGFSLGLEPVWPSRIQHELHGISVQTTRTLRFADVAALGAFGVDPARYQSFEYQGCQALAAAAHFMEFDGLLVPSARHDSHNLVVFMDRENAASLNIRSTVPVDWPAWRRANNR
jgi:RES domain-containing protein